MTLKSPRIDLVDSLRGYALLAIVLLHNLEHYNLYFFPEYFPEWLKILDKGVWDVLFFTFAGKAYATFSLLFGFSFYIQFRNERQRGGDFRGRFAWRMFLLFLFSQLHALFYNGDILLLYSVVGLTLIPVATLKDKTVLIIASILMLQPMEWARVVYAVINPEYVTTWGTNFMIYSEKAYSAMIDGSYLDILKSNIWDGQLYSNFWQVESGRLFQTSSLFMFGMLLGRRSYFIKSKESLLIWKKILTWGIIAFVPLFVIKTYLPDYIENTSIKSPLSIIIPSLTNFTFMCVLVSSFTLLWFKSNGFKFQRFIIPYGRMSLTNYIFQSIIGSLCIMVVDLDCINTRVQPLLLLLLWLYLVFKYVLVYGGSIDINRVLLNIYGKKGRGLFGGLLELRSNTL